MYILLLGFDDDDEIGAEGELLGAGILLNLFDEDEVSDDKTSSRTEANEKEPDNSVVIRLFLCRRL